MDSPVPTSQWGGRREGGLTSSFFPLSMTLTPRQEPAMSYARRVSSATMSLSSFCMLNLDRSGWKVTLVKSSPSKCLILGSAVLVMLFCQVCVGDRTVKKAAKTGETHVAALHLRTCLKLRLYSLQDVSTVNLLLEVSRWPKMSAGTYIFSSLCSTTGMPRPLFHTEMMLDSLQEEEEEEEKEEEKHVLKVTEASLQPAHEARGNAIEKTAKPKLYYTAQSPGCYKGQRLIEVGTGPALHTVLSACAHYEEIVLSDYVEVNRRELDKWLRAEEGHFDWRAHMQFVCDLEGTRKDTQTLADAYIIPACGLAAGVSDVIKLHSDTPGNEKPSLTCHSAHHDAALLFSQIQ
ncbi:hypothetical protein CRUP_027940 [Coryphaenoides rupestris]|nr:hypothetical protein CRUP_027940 [Coryphaenoides rupestris]